MVNRSAAPLRAEPSVLEIADGDHAGGGGADVRRCGAGPGPQQMHAAMSGKDAASIPRPLPRRPGRGAAGDPLAHDALDEHCPAPALVSGFKVYGDFASTLPALAEEVGKHPSVRQLAERILQNEPRQDAQNDQDDLQRHEKIDHGLPLDQRGLAGHAGCAPREGWQA